MSLEQSPLLVVSSLNSLRNNHTVIAETINIYDIHLSKKKKKKISGEKVRL